jgi:O-acetylserine/cysteine efflux transporter
MRGRHALAAVTIAAIWGLSFIVVRIGLNHFPPLFMAALRFAISALAVIVLPRPNVPWRLMIAIGLTLFVGEFGFLFTGMSRGMPPGLASIAIQSQAFFTLILAACISRAMPAARQQIGTFIGLTGLLVVASTIGGDVAPAGLVLTIAAAMSWAAGNVLLKRAGQVDMLSMVAWLSLVPPIPLLLLSLAIEGPAAITSALAGVGGAAIGAILYLSIGATLIAFAMWGRLLKLYPVQIVAPFSLLVPLFGISSAAVVYGEKLGPGRLLGMSLIIIGLITNVIPYGLKRRQAPV